MRRNLAPVFLLSMSSVSCGGIPLNQAYVPPLPEPLYAKHDTTLTRSIAATQSANANDRTNNHGLLPANGESLSSTTSESTPKSTATSSNSNSKVSSDAQANSPADLNNASVFPQAKVKNTSPTVSSVSVTPVNNANATPSTVPNSETNSLANPKVVFGKAKTPVKNAQALFDQGHYQQAIDQIKHSEQSNQKLLASAYQALIQQYDRAGDLEAVRATMENYLSDLPSVKHANSAQTTKQDLSLSNNSAKTKHKMSAKQKKQIASLNFKAAYDYQAREFDRAKVSWHKVLKLDPKNSEALQGLDNIRKWEAFLSKIPPSSN